MDRRLSVWSLFATLKMFPFSVPTPHLLLQPHSLSSTFYLLLSHHLSSSCAPSPTLYLQLHLPATIGFFKPHTSSPFSSSTVSILQLHPSISSTVTLHLFANSQRDSFRHPCKKKGKKFGSNQICVIESRRLCGGASAALNCFLSSSLCCVAVQAKLITLTSLSESLFIVSGCCWFSFCVWESLSD